MKKKLLKIGLFLLILFITVDTNSCTTFFINKNGNLIFGRNFDFYSGFGHVIVNKRNVLKSSYIQPVEKSFE